MRRGLTCLWRSLPPSSSEGRKEAGLGDGWRDGLQGGVRVEDWGGGEGGRDVSPGDQHVGSVGQVGHWRGVGQALGVVRLVVVVWKVVEDIARIVWRWEALGMGILASQIVRHLGFVCGGKIIQGSRGYIGLRGQAEHSLQTAVILRAWRRMIGRFRSMVSWSWGWSMVSRSGSGSMVSWSWSRSMVSRSWSGRVIDRSRVIGRVNSEYFLQSSTMGRFSVTRWRVVIPRLGLRSMIGWLWVMHHMMIGMVVFNVMVVMTMVHHMSHMWILLHVVQWHM